MKLRIKGDSVRLRLTRQEVRELDERGEVANKIRFDGGAALVYRVKRDAVVGTLSAAYDRNTIEVLIPEQVARTWCNTDVITLEYTRHTEEGGLHIIVEKDFSCLEPRAGEDESDQFPHPRASAAKDRCLG
jgi:hypothetical protein